MTESEKKPKTIGIIGGMGPLAGVELHKRIIEHTIASKDQDHLPVIHFSLAHLIADRTQYLLGNTSSNPADEINKIIQEMNNLGVDLIAIACNTSHSPRIFNQIHSDKIISILDATLNYLLSNNINEVGFIGTNGSLKTKLYENHFNKHAIKVRTLSEDLNNKFIHEAIYNSEFGIKAIGANNKAIDLILKGIKEFGEANIILGCTELSLVKNDISSKFNIIDPLDALALSLIFNALNRIS